MSNIIISLLILISTAIAAEAIPSKNSATYLAPIGSQVYINGDHAGATEDLVVNGSIFASSSINGNSLIINGATLITSPTDFFKNGGENGEANRSLGNLDDYDLSFKTNGQAAITIDDNGYVGIGYSNPSVKLNVNGDIVASGNLSINGATADIGALSLAGVLAITEGTAPSATNGYGKIYVSSANNHLYFMDNGGAATDLHTTAGGGGAGIALSNLNNVAINTSLLPDTDDNGDLGSSGSAWKDLWLSGDAYFSQYLYHKGDTDTNVNFSTDALTISAGGENFITISEDTQDVIELGDDGDIDIKLSAGADGTLFVNGSSAQVGINTTNTNEKLTVNGAISLVQTSIPSGTTGYGKLYVNGSNLNLYYVNGRGIQSDLVAGVGGGATAIDGLTDGIFSGGSTSVYLGNGAGATSIGSAYNTALGVNGLDLINGGDYNTALGYGSAASITSGNGNIAIGYQAGDNLDTGNGNIIIGNDIEAQSASGSNQLSIANLIFGTSIDETGTTVSDGNIGIGIASPAYRLHVNGTLATTGAASFGSTLSVTSSSTLIDDVTISAELAINGATAAAGALALNGALAFEETATAPALTSDYGKIYVKTDHYPYFKDKDGVETNLLTGSGAIDDLSDAIYSGAGTSLYLGNNGGASIAGATYNTSVGVNGLAAIQSTGIQNTALGYDALKSVSTGDNNTAIGAFALKSNTGSSNTAVGNKALFSNSTGTLNSAFGHLTLNGNTTGNYNTAFGAQSLVVNSTGSSNTSVGYYSLVANTIGRNNTAIGYHALKTNTTGIGNSIVGSNGAESNTTGSFNTSVGDYALNGNTTADGNTCLGYKCLNSSTGANNTAFGYQAGDNITTGTNNIIIGYNVDAPAANSNSKLNIGDTIYGDLSTDYVGISDTNPAATLDVNGNAIFNGTLTATGASTLAGLTASTGSFSSTLTASGNLTVNTDKFTVEATSGNTVVAGTLNVTGTSTLTSLSASSATINGSIAGVNNLAVVSISSENGNTVNVDLNSSAGNDFTVNANYLVVEGDTGRVGIGTSTPTRALDVVGSAYLTGDLSINGDLLIGDDTADGALDIRDGNGSFLFNGSSVDEAYIASFWMDDTGLAIGHNHNNRRLDLQTNSTTRLSIAANGDVGIGTTSPASKLSIVSSTDEDVLSLSDNGGTTSCEANPGSSMTWACSSDIRLKKDIVDTAPILASLMKFKIKDFTMISSGERSTGVIAQEVQESFPELVSTGDNGYLRVDTPNQWQLIKAIQELKTESDQLTAILCKDHPEESICQELYE